MFSINRVIERVKDEDINTLRYFWRVWE